MVKIVQFTPQSSVDATKNVEAFIRFCKKLRVFGEDLDWESNNWGVSKYLGIRGRKARTALVFSNHDTAGRSKKGPVPMAQPFRDFAKGYMRYQHSLRPTKDIGKRMAALRALEKVLVERSSDGIPHIETTDPDTLNSIAQLLKKQTGLLPIMSLINSFLFQDFWSTINLLRLGSLGEIR